MFARPLPVIAADSRLESITSGFRNNRAEVDTGDVFLFLAGLAAIFMLLWLISRWTDHRARRDSPFRLFLALAKAHRLRWLDCWLLWRIARENAVAQPALLFLDPGLTSARTLARIAPQEAERLAVIRRRIFTGLEEVAETPVTAAIHRIGAALNRMMTGEKQPDQAAEHAEGKRETWTSELPDRDPREAQEPTILSLFDEMERKNLPRPNAPQAARRSPGDSPSTGFPQRDTPALDLYPWLSNNWQLNNADESNPQ